jgi:hypothetical protein
MKTSDALKIYEKHQADPWFGLSHCTRDGELSGRIIELGHELVAGILAVVGMLKPGHYAVLAYVPSDRKRLPDWGTFRKISPGRWVLKSADGLSVSSTDRLGAVHTFGLPY